MKRGTYLNLYDNGDIYHGTKLVGHIESERVFSYLLSIQNKKGFDRMIIMDESRIKEILDRDSIPMQATEPEDLTPHLEDVKI